jgi:hypothetical protein|tara:strand:- start:285 stop:1655 length:1371 start_codon:yes stop_codon:yes gene_type:complete
MAYTITKTDGTTLGTIVDGTINTSFTSVTLIGKNYSDYGQLIANDLVHMIENFARSSSPANPLAGQLWWSTSTNRLSVYTGSAFKTVSSATSQGTAPTTTVSGDIWWDTSYGQLYVYDGTTPFNVAGWKLVGPQRNGSGALWETITDSGASSHNVLSLYLDNARTQIISKDADFTPQTPIIGYATIKQGINGNTSLNSATIWATANNASYLGGQLAASYLRSDAEDTATNKITLANVVIGLDTNASIISDSTGNVTITNNKAGDIVFKNGSLETLTIDSNSSMTRMVAADITTNLTVRTTATVVGLLSGTTGTFSGNLSAVTQGTGTADTTVATTQWVTNNSGLYPYKVNKASWTYAWMDTTTANLVVANTQVLSATTSGVALTSGATAVTQGIITPTAFHQYFANTSALGNTTIATGNYVSKATQYWSGSAKWVSTTEPDASAGKDGDFWFQREA